MEAETSQISAENKTQDWRAKVAGHLHNLLQVVADSPLLAV